MFRTSCKVVQRNNKKREKKKAHTQIHKLFFKPKHIWMIMEPCVALKKKKKKHMYLSHCLHELLQFYRPQSRLGQSEVALCILFFKDALSTEVAAKSHWSVMMWDWWRRRCGVGGGGVNSAYSLGGWGVYGLEAHPLCQLALEWPCGPLPLPSGLSSDGVATMGGVAVGGAWGGCALGPWCINQKALLAVLLRSSASSPCLPTTTPGLPLPFGSFIVEEWVTDAGVTRAQFGFLLLLLLL